MDKHECLRCGHKWVRRIDKPHMCPSCKSIIWNKPKVLSPQSNINKQETKEARTEEIKTSEVLSLHKPETI